MKTKIVGKDKSGVKKEQVVNDKQLLDILLNFAGGGYSTSQTAKAMLNKAKLNDGETVKLKYGKNFYTFIPLPGNT